tara:strand:- start:185150 stop:187312 length:2163 start_codon:yes stop_codon:yes gene_type:complete
MATPFVFNIEEHGRKMEAERLSESRVADPYIEFGDVLRDYGIEVNRVEATDKDFIRADSAYGKKGNKNGFYKFQLIDNVATGIFGDWSVSDEPQYWRSNSYKLLSPDERRAHDAKSAALKEHSRQEMLRRQSDTAIRASQDLQRFASCLPEHDHPYLKAKGVQAIGLKTDGQNLYLPVVCNGKVTSYQTITAEGDKYFLRDGKILGGYHFIKSNGSNLKTYFVEGYSTGVTIANATGGNVVVCFFASNLYEVVKNERARSNDPIVIAADNDHTKRENAGLKYAEKCVNEFSNVSMVYPEAIQGSDFNDMAAEKGLEEVKKVFGQRKNLIDIFQVDEMEMKTPDWFIKKILPRENITMFYGASGHMKSFVVIDMALHLAAGMDWHGNKVKAECSTLYLCGEGANGINKRVKAWKKYHGVEKPLPFYMTSMPVALLEQDQTNMMLESLHDFMFQRGLTTYPPTIIVDTLNRNFGNGDENNTKDMTSWIGAATEISAITGSMFIIVHHSGKSEGATARGSSALKGAVDCEYHVSMINEEAAKDGLEAPKIRLHCTKMKDYEEPKDIFFEPNSVQLGIDEDGDPITSVVLMPINDIALHKGQSVDSTIQSILTQPAGTAKNAQEKTKLVYRDTLLKVAKGIATKANQPISQFIFMPVNDINTVFRSECIFHGIQPNSSRVAKSRAIEELSKVGLINNMREGDQQVSSSDKAFIALVNKSAGYGE